MGTDTETDGNEAERLNYILRNIKRAANRFDAEGRDVALVAVSKTFAPADIVPLLDAGHRIFGENRVQEAQEKWPSLRSRYSDIELHLIGPLQSNKVRDAVALFDVIESVDREKLARKLAAEMSRAGRQLPVFVQVNIGEEGQKAGVSPKDTLGFIDQCRSAFGLNVQGLMCIPPADVPPGPYFAQLAGLAQQAGLSQLSMGMSADYETAIAMGATHVRVGSALFGKRPRTVNHHGLITGN